MDTAIILDQILFDGKGRSTTATPFKKRNPQIIGLSASVSSILKRDLYVNGWLREKVLLNISNIPSSITHSHVRCSEDKLATTLKYILFRRDASRAFVFVPASVKLSAARDLLVAQGLDVRAVCDTVNGVTIDAMPAARNSLSTWLAAATPVAPAIVVATLEAVRSPCLSLFLILLSY